MEAFSDSTTCLICFQITARHIFVPADASVNILNNCKTYLHSTLTKATLKDGELRNENQMPLCKSCFDSALELTQLSEQLAVLQKEISDLTVTFNMAVFYRRSQVYNDGMQNSSRCANKSSVIELNVSCLPSNISWTKDESQNIQKLNEKNNHNVIIDDLPDSHFEVTNVKYEIIDYQFGNLTEDCQQNAASDNNSKMLFRTDNRDKNCNQQAVENPTNRNLAQSEVNSIPTKKENESLDSSHFKDVRQLTMSDLMKSVRMPHVKVERMKMTSFTVNASCVNSSPKKSVPIRQIHNGIKYKDKDFSNSNCVSNVPEAGKRLKCFYCEKTFKRVDHRNSHHRTHIGEPLKGSFNKNRFRDKQKLYEKTDNGGKYFECKFCQKRFTTFRWMKNHEISHTGNQRFKCSFCQKRFHEKTILQIHERTHTGEKRFGCSFCEKRFKSNGGLKAHERSHTGEKPYECLFCTKKFTSLTGKNDHERTHTGEKPYRCSYCEKPFSKIGNRDRHQKIHKKKPLSLICSFGKQIVDSLDRLKYHQKVQTDAELSLKTRLVETQFSKIAHKQINNADDGSTENDFIVGI